MAEAAKDPKSVRAEADPATSDASLSQKAEKLAARLEEHKNRAQAEVAEQAAAARRAAAKAAIKGEAPQAAQPSSQPAAAAAPPAAQKAAPAKTTSTAAAAAKPAPAKPAPAKPAAAKPAAAKPAAGKAAPVKPAAKKTAPAKPAAPAAPAKTTVQPKVKAQPSAETAVQPVEDVIRAIKLPHEIEAEEKAKAQQQAAARAATSAEPELKKTAAPGAAVPPVSVAPQEDGNVSTAAAVAQARSRVFGSYGPEEERSEAAVKRRVARERALNSKPALGRTFQVLVAVIFPVLTLITAIRLVATPVFLAMAYGRPGFPSDQYGFTDPERLTYGSYGVDYLNNFAGPEYLSGLVLPTGSALFSAGEVQHMVDVKNLIGIAYVIGVVLLALMIVGIWYLVKRYAGGVRRALFSGAIVTLAGIAALVVLAILGWQSFFTEFHALFFSEGTWTFNVTDTLIRLYPEQFWIDSAIAVAALVLVTVIVVLISCWPTGKRREASRLRQEARAFGLGG